MSRLQYRGIKTGLETITHQDYVDSEVKKLPTKQSMQADVSNALSSLITEQSASSSLSQLIDRDNLPNLFSGVVDSSQLGSSIAQLDSGKKYPQSYFNPQTTRGAKLFGSKGSTTNLTTKNGWGSMTLATLDVSNPAPKYLVLAWAQLEAKAAGGGTRPDACIETESNGTVLSWGMGKYDYTSDWQVLEVLPVNIPYIYSGTTRLLLSARRLGPADIEYSGYETVFTALTIPVTN